MHRPGASLQVGLGTWPVHLISPGPPQDEKEQIHLTCPTPTFHQFPAPARVPSWPGLQKPGPGWGLCTQLWGADERHPAQGQAHSRCSGSVHFHPLDTHKSATEVASAQGAVGVWRRGGSEKTSWRRRTWKQQGALRSRPVKAHAFCFVFFL